MPIYEYACKNCGTHFEKMQPITSDPIKVCPNCGAEQVHRVIQPVGVIFKGSGWYINDSRKSNSESLPAASKSDSSGDSSSESKSDSKSESKSDGPVASTSDSGGKSDSASGSKAE